MTVVLQLLVLGAILALGIDSHCVNNQMISYYSSIEHDIQRMKKYNPKCIISPSMDKLVKSIHLYSNKLVKEFHRLYNQYNKRYWKKYSGSCYLLARQTTTWNDAQIRCQEMNSSLVTIETLKENKWLHQLAQDKGSDRYWTGLVAKKRHQFEWHLSKEKPTFLRFAKDYPRPYPYKCVYFYNGLWYNAACSEHRYFICESQSC